MADLTVSRLQTQKLGNFSFPLHSLKGSNIVVSIAHSRAGNRTPAAAVRAPNPNH